MQNHSLSYYSITNINCNASAVFNLTEKKVKGKTFSQIYLHVKDNLFFSEVTPISLLLIAYLSPKSMDICMFYIYFSTWNVIAIK